MYQVDQSNWVNQPARFYVRLALAAVIAASNNHHLLPKVGGLPLVGEDNVSPGGIPASTLSVLVGEPSECRKEICSMYGQL